MKFLKCLFSVTIILVLCVFLVANNPGKNEFCHWYVEEYEKTGYGEFFDEALEKIVYTQTEEQNFLIFSVYEIEDQRYCAVAGLFFGRYNLEHVQQTLEDLMEKAKDIINEVQSSGNEVQSSGEQ